MINTPDWLKPRINVVYPPNNFEEFEYWFFKHYDKDETDREYLPIYWTAYFVNNNYGDDKEALKKLQDYIDSLDSTKKYYTIIQYDDAILNDVSRLDLYQFNMSKPYDYPLPLIGQPYPFIFTNPEKKYLANFIGGKTHEIREHAKSLMGKEGYYISFDRHDPYEYCKILSESVFTLCYRGYGQNSFRVAEALQYGSIPIIIYTDGDLIQPHNLDIAEYGGAIQQSALSDFDEIIKCYYIRQEQREHNSNIYKEYFTYEGTKNKILEYLQTIK